MAVNHGFCMVVLLLLAASSAGGVRGELAAPLIAAGAGVIIIKPYQAKGTGRIQKNLIYSAFVLSWMSFLV